MAKMPLSGPLLILRGYFAGPYPEKKEKNFPENPEKIFRGIFFTFFFQSSLVHMGYFNFFRQKFFLAKKYPPLN